MQFSTLQKNVYVKIMIYNFSRMFVDLFQGLTFQNDPFYSDCLVLRHSFFAFYSLKHVLHLEFCLLCFFHRGIRNCFIYMRFLIALKYLNFIFFGTCLLSASIIFFLEIWVIMFSLTNAEHKIILKTFERKIWIVKINQFLGFSDLNIVFITE